MLAKHRPAVGLLAILLAALSASVARLLAATPVILPTSSAPSAQFKHGAWPFCPPTRPPVPTVKNGAWVRNPIDAFILHALEEQGLEPSPSAEKLVLLRRGDVRSDRLAADARGASGVSGRPVAARL